MDRRMDARYPALRMLSTGYKVLGAMCIVAAFLLVLGAFVAYSRLDTDVQKAACVVAFVLSVSGSLVSAVMFFRTPSCSNF